jgi:hypothetical protein
MATLAQILARGEYATEVQNKDVDALFATLNANTETVVASTRVTEIAILAQLGAVAGEAFLSAIENQAGSTPILARILRWLKTDHGLDVGNSEVRGTLDSLVTANILDGTSTATVKAMAHKLTSVAIRDLGRPVTEQELTAALNVQFVTKYFDAEGNEVQANQPYAYTQEVRA